MKVLRMMGDRFKLLLREIAVEIVERKLLKKLALFIRQSFHEDNRREIIYF